MGGFLHGRSAQSPVNNVVLPEGFLIINLIKIIGVIDKNIKCDKSSMGQIRSKFHNETNGFNTRVVISSSPPDDYKINQFQL